MYLAIDLRYTRLIDVIKLPRLLYKILLTFRLMPEDDGENRKYTLKCYKIITLKYNHVLWTTMFPLIVTSMLTPSLYNVNAVLVFKTRMDECHKTNLIEVATLESYFKVCHLAIRQRILSNSENAKRWIGLLIPSFSEDVFILGVFFRIFTMPPLFSWDWKHSLTKWKLVKKPRLSRDAFVVQFYSKWELVKNHVWQ